MPFGGGSISVGFEQGPAWGAKRTKCQNSKWGGEMRGRKPKPSGLKLITGTDRADRGNPDEPQPQPACPEPPDHLKAEARSEWTRVSHQLNALGILSEMDRAALGA